MSAQLFYRIVYGSFYTFLYVVLLALLLAVPGDIFRQAVPSQKIYHIIIISACYVVTVLIVALVYFARLYVNRTVLASIPKSWIPIDKGDVSKNVRKMIVDSLSRSAAIAYEARPRVGNPVPTSEAGGGAQLVDEKNEEAEPARRKSSLLPRVNKAPTVEDELGITLPPHKAVWGEIEHPGWASPVSPDLTNVQYISVISELPNLIEAKALTLAPPDPDSRTTPPLLDPEAVALLQRPAAMGLRDYLAHLMEIGVLMPSVTVRDFVAMYEHARFSTCVISETRFRELMHRFADILRTMEPVDLTLLQGVDSDDDDDDEDDHAGIPPSESDIDNDAPIATNPTTPRSQRSRRSLRSQLSQKSHASMRSAASSRATNTTGSSTNSSGSQIRRRPGGSQPVRTSSANTWQQYRTAPTTPKSRRTALSRTSSANSFAQTRRPYLVSQSSSASLRSAASSAGGSVIRLADRRDETELPYVLRLGDGM